MTEHEESELCFIVEQLRDSIIAYSRRGDYDISLPIDNARWQLQKLMREVQGRKSKVISGKITSPNRGE